MRHAFQSYSSELTTFVHKSYLRIFRTAVDISPYAPVNIKRLRSWQIIAEDTKKEVLFP